MGRLSLIAMSAVIIGAMAYMPPGKEPFLTDALLREVVDRMGKDLADAADNYLDFPDSGARLSSLGALLPGRSVKDLEAEEQQFPLDYDRLAELANPNPSIRDQEYLQHSSLWGHQFMTGGLGGAGEGKQHLKPDGTVDNQKDVKSDSALPAYCNPPNPCPVGYVVEDGCLERFENTAVFSRDFQAAQDCMCDSEHMFDCPADTGRDAAAAAAAAASAAAAAASVAASAGAEFTESDIDRIMEQFQIEDQHKTLVAKKFHVKKDSNPFLRGEKLPVAAKKGNNVVY